MRTLSILWIFLVMPLMAGAQHRHKHEAVQRTEMQTDQLCAVLQGTIGDAASDFMHVRGKELDVTGTTVVYAVSKGMPGATVANVVNDGGWRYEAVMFQGNVPEDMMKAYRGLRTQVVECLHPQGYHELGIVNNDRSNSVYPDLVYSTRENVPPGAHPAGSVQILVTFSQVNGVYTVTLVVNK